MFKVTKYPHGTFSWADCASTDAEKAKRFYKVLMGWDSEELPMGGGEFYTRFMVNGEKVGALSQMQPDMQAQGVPSHWTNYVTVDNVDTLESKVTELGGKVLAPPFDVFDAGRMMVIQDPTGGSLALWQAKTDIGATLVNTVGAMMWNELMTSDMPKAMAFYKDLLGWEFEQDGDRDYYMIKNNGRMNGGILPMREDMGNAPAFWMVYYNVADLDAAVKKVAELGGVVHVPKLEVPGIGHLAVIADPAGAVITIMESDQIQPWTEN
jgi:uncharacterized protein